MERVGLLMLLVAAVTASSHLNNSTHSQVSRTGCGVTKVCVETPDDCDPAANSTCLFASVDGSHPTAPNGSDLSVELRGDSMGYVALGLTLNSSMGSTVLFICAQNSSNNGTFFRTMLRNNTDNALSPTTDLSVTGTQISVEDNVIRCMFNVLNVNATSNLFVRSSHVTTFTLLLGTGSSDGGNVGAFNVSLNSGPLNLHIMATAAPNTMAPNTTAPSNATTTSGASGAVHNHAALLLLSVVSLSVMLRA